MSGERADGAPEAELVPEVEGPEAGKSPRGDSPSLKPSGSSRPRWVVIAAAAAVVLVVIAVVLSAVVRNNDHGKAPVAAVNPQPAGNPTELLQQGLAAQGAGRLDDARSLYQKAIDQEPTNKFANYNLGVIYQQLNAVNDARNAYNRALKIDANYQPALFNLAVMETPVNPTVAVSLYQKLLTINPNDANVHLNLGLLFKQLGRAAEGDAELKKALELDPALASRLPAK